jgi:putative thioredoxin
MRLRTVSIASFKSLSEVDQMAELDNIIDVSEETFDMEVVERSFEVPVVVDFWAPWCGPCRMLGPILERLAADPNLDFILAKVNVDNNPRISMQFQVQGIPAVKAFLNGEVVAEFTGALPEARVRQFIEKLIPSEVDDAFNEAKSLLATHHWAEAEAFLTELIEEYPTYPGAGLQLARALLAQGKGCDAIEYLENSTDGPALLQAQRLLPLANFLCRASSDDEDGVDPDELEPIEMQYRQAARLLQRSNFEAAMDGLIDVLRQNKRYRKSEPRNVMLAIFELLGDSDTLTLSYRNELASVLF